MRLLRDFLESAGDVGAFGWRALKEAFRRPFEIDEVSRQLNEVGLRSVPLILAAGLAVGIVMSLHTRSSLVRFGAQALIPQAMAIAFVRELGPLMTGLLVSGRAGAGIGAELAGMRVTEQIDALEALAVDSFKYLVVTRVMACIIAMPILTTFLNLAGLVGGFTSEAIASHMSFMTYVDHAFDQMDWSDYIPSTLKTMVFGLIIGTVASYLGYNAKNGATGVGRASTQSVVWTSLLLILTNVILVKILFFWFPQLAG